ncbi:hypothetical protein [Desulfuribacillus alkaliarsenatis]|nr:hypothetical protein [Desulfuribacillus alkaliarsenatis]
MDPKELKQVSAEHQDKIDPNQVDIDGLGDSSFFNEKDEELVHSCDE